MAREPSVRERIRLKRGAGGGGGFVADLRTVMAERDFRRLFATRLVSQAGDGAFSAGLGTYVFFNATTFPSPTTAATAFTVLYLPYSLIGPFIGVFIDRWSRRQILVRSALARAVLVAFTAALMASGSLGTPLYIAVLGVLGVNRFFLASLSAALPHVVREDKLVMANAVAPTGGTIVAFLGGLIGLGVHLASGGGRGGSAVTLLAAAGCYLLAGAAGATMHRDLLGPPRLAPGEHRARLRTELAVVASGLVQGARHVWQRRPAAAALGATSAQRAMYGALLLTSILLYRNYFYRTSGANASLAHFTLVVIAAAFGYGLAAVLTPMGTKRVSTAAWIALMLTVGGIITAGLGPTFAQPAFLVIALVLGIVAQGVAICSVTILQQEVDDTFRGRVFALYDMLFNLPFVIGAAAAAQLLPDSGHSYLVVLAAGAGYLVAAAAYAAVSRHSLLAGPSSVSGRPAGPADGASVAPGSPSAAAQPRSS
ncbi:MAG TPA: MFS transporter [Streptosporangiaceae bacterium]|nr:MFS transporter [Streptosporangiaceae bacterium]